ncbi:MAG: hypothetical protein RMK19_04840 [Bacteroidia bacterium]|nr:hypothetical protein [Bacteroidia bacterium]MDW8015318.1 hypothetical protein [Bacteroidia bacterium]
MESYMVFVANTARKILPVGILDRVILLCLIVGVGCSPSVDNSASVEGEEDSVYAIPWEEIEVYMKAAPSPVQVALWLRQEKVPFLREPLHDPTLSGRYTGLQGAANLGIYLTDMAYAHATSNYQEAYEYLSSVNRLAARYGIDDIFSLERIRALERLQDKPDSVQRLMSQYYSEVQARLEEMGQQPMLRHMILGGWIESLHITLALLERDSSRQPLAEMIALQKNLLPLFIKVYGVDTASSVASRQVLMYLVEVQRVLNNLTIGGEEMKATPQVQKGLIQIQFQEGARLSATQLLSLKQPVARLREFLIKV